MPLPDIAVHDCTDTMPDNRLLDIQAIYLHTLSAKHIQAETNSNPDLRRILGHTHVHIETERSLIAAQTHSRSQVTVRLPSAMCAPSETQHAFLLLEDTKSSQRKPIIHSKGFATSLTNVDCQGPLEALVRCSTEPHGTCIAVHERTSPNSKSEPRMSGSVFTSSSEALPASSRTPSVSVREVDEW